MNYRDEDNRDRKQLTELSEGAWSSLFFNSTLMLAVAAPDCSALREVNQPFMEQTGLVRVDCLGSSLADLGIICSADQELIQGQLKAGNEVRDLDLRLTFQDGQQISGRLSVTAVNTADQPNLLLTIVDSSGSELMRDRLAENYEQHCNLYDSAVVGLFQTRFPDGVLLKANAEAARIMEFGDIADTIRQGTSISSYYPPDQRQRIHNILLTKGHLDSQEITFCLPSGKRLEVAVSARIYPHKGYVEGSMIDITQRKRTERERERLDAILENSPDLVAMASPVKSITYLNSAGRRILGIAPDIDVTAMTLMQFHPAWAFQNIMDTVLPTALEHGIWEGETAIITQQGRELPVSLVFVAHKGADGDVEYFSVIMRDISELKHTERALSERLTRARRHEAAIVQMSTCKPAVTGDFQAAAQTITAIICDASDVERASIWLLSADGRELRCKDLYVRSSKSHSDGATLRAADYPMYFENMRAGRAIDAHDAVNDPRTCEFAATYLKPQGISAMLDAPIRLSGKLIGVMCLEHVGGNRTWYDDEVAFCAESADQITQALLNSERKKAELELRRTYGTLERVISEAPFAAQVLEVTPDGPQFTMANRESNRIFGQAFLPGSSADPLVRGELAARLRDPGNNELIPCALFPLARALDGETVKAEEYKIARRGKSAVYVSLNASPIVDDAGKVVAVVSVIQDVTEQKRAEEDRRSYIKFLENLELVDQIIRQSDDLDQMLQDVITTVFTMYGSDRIWLLNPCDPDADEFNIPIEECSPDYPGALAIGGVVPNTPWLANYCRDVLHSQGPVIYGEGTDRQMDPDTLNIFNVKSMMITPVYPKVGKPWVFGIHQCAEIRHWSLSEQHLFREIGNRLADALSSLISLRNLRESRKRYKSLVSNIPGTVYRCQLDSEWTMQYISESVQGLTGYPADDFTASKVRTYTSIMNVDDRKYVEEEIDVALKQGCSFNLEYRIIDAAGETRWVAERGQGVSLNGDDTSVIDGVIFDITDQKMAELELSRLNAELSSANEILSTTNEEMIAVNEELVLTNIELEDSQLRLQDSERTVRTKLEALTKPEGDYSEFRFTDLFDLEEIIELQDAFARTHGVSSIITNQFGEPITEPSNFCRLCKDFIRQTELGKLNCLHSDAEIGKPNQDGPTIQACLSGGLMVAGTSFVIGGHHVANWLIGQVRVQRDDDDELLAYATEIGADLEEYKAALAEVPVMALSHFQDVAQTLHLVTKQLSESALHNIQQAREISERQRAEAALLLNESRLGAMIDLYQMSGASTKNLIEFVLETGIQLTNSMIGYIAFTNRDATVLTMRAWSDPDQDECPDNDIPKTFKVAETGLLGEAVRQGKPIITNDYQADNPQKNGYPADHVHVDRYMNIPISDGKRIVAVVGVGNKPGEYDESDVRQLTLLMEGLWQIMQRRRAEDELRESESQLLQSEKLAAIGELASGVAHELNQPLNHISITVQLLERMIQKENAIPTDILNELGVIRGSITRAVTIIRSMREFSRRETSEAAPVDVRQAISSALMMFGAQLRTHNIELIVEQPDTPVIIMGSENYLSQVIVNLITNARDGLDACQDDRAKLIRLEVQETTDTAVLRLSDNGRGIPERIIGSIFNPFFTTKEPGAGTGLGLSISHRIIEGFGGTISAQSVENEGTMITICIPQNKSEISLESHVARG